MEGIIQCSYNCAGEQCECNHEVATQKCIRDNGTTDRQKICSCLIHEDNDCTTCSTEVILRCEVNDKVCRD